jgi:hypothetical protein
MREAVLPFRIVSGRHVYPFCIKTWFSSPMPTPAKALHRMLLGGLGSPRGEEVAWRILLFSTETYPFPLREMLETWTPPSSILFYVPKSIMTLGSAPREP